MAQQRKIKYEEYGRIDWAIKPTRKKHEIGNGWIKVIVRISGEIKHIEGD
jgi:hypothetical protein